MVDDIRDILQELLNLTDPRKAPYNPLFLFGLFLLCGSRPDLGRILSLYHVPIRDPLHYYINPFMGHRPMRSVVASVLLVLFADNGLAYLGDSSLALVWLSTSEGY